MLLLVSIIILLVIGKALGGHKDNSAYDDYCNIECWSRRRPCCKVS